MYPCTCVMFGHSLHQQLWQRAHASIGFWCDACSDAYCWSRILYGMPCSPLWTDRYLLIQKCRFTLSSIPFVYNQNNAHILTIFMQIFLISVCHSSERILSLNNVIIYSNYVSSSIVYLSCGPVKISFVTALASIDLSHLYGQMEN